MLYEKYLSEIDRQTQDICALAEAIWDNAELP